MPESVDYNLWCGPAPMAPLMRKNLHYDWHWIWPTGDGDFGNNGIHYMDLCRWFAGQQELAPRVLSLGGRFGYVDDGETPNTKIVFYDYKPVPILFELRGLPRAKGESAMDNLRGVNDGGVIVECENGYFAGGWAYDKAGKKIKQFRLTEGAGHHENFIQAVRSRKASDLNADVLEGHLSAALCHMGNISYRLGKEASRAEIVERFEGNQDLGESFERFQEHLLVNGVDREADAAHARPLADDGPADRESSRASSPTRPTCWPAGPIASRSSFRNRCRGRSPCLPSRQAAVHGYWKGVPWNKRTPWQSPRVPWWRSIGPALITACVVFGPGSLLITSNVGARYGYELLWLLVLTGVLMGTFMTMAARVGVVGGATPCTLIAGRLGRPVAAVIGLNLCLICAAFQFSNNLAVAAAFDSLGVKRLFGDPAQMTQQTQSLISTGFLLAFNGLVIASIFALRQVYKGLERIMKIMVAVILACFLVNLLVIRPDIGGILGGLIPGIPENLSLALPKRGERHRGPHGAGRRAARHDLLRGRRVLPGQSRPGEGLDDRRLQPAASAIPSRAWRS